MPKRAAPLKAKTIQHLKANGTAQRTVVDGLVPGLRIRVSKTGRKTWSVRYKANGKRRKLKLGTYPATSLKEARERARKVFARVEKGEDPARDRDDRRAGKNTFEALAREVLAVKEKQTRESTHRERERIVESELIPAWGDRPAGEIKRRDVIELTDGIVTRGSPAMANKTLSVVKLIFNEGIRRGFAGLEASPAYLVQRPGNESGRDRYLTREEIKTVWEATEPESPIMRAIFRLTLLTAQRVGAVKALRWDQIDDADVWTIPAESFKGKRRHMVPLSAEALEVLEEVRPMRRDGWAFPGRADGSEPHVTGHNSALRRVRQRTEEKGVADWTLHDARTTFRTHAERPEEPDHPRDAKGLGIDPRTADAVLGHKEASVGREHYQAEPWRYRLSEKREALRRWGRFVRTAVEEEER